MKNKIKIVESRTLRGAYNIPYDEMIVDHPKHGRLYLSEGFGGGTCEGQTYRWRHGFAAKIKSDDTFADLDRYQSDEDPMPIRIALAGGYPTPGRELLDWDGFIVKRVAFAAK